MKRGFLFLDALLALALLAALAAAAFPAIGHIAGAAAAEERRLHEAETALFSCSYIADKIRWSLRRTPEGAVTDTQCVVTAEAQDGTLRPYTLYVLNHQWTLRLYTGRTQPLTGGETPLLYEVRAAGDAPYFRGEPGGLVHLSYEVGPAGMAEGYAVSAAVLPLADFFLMGAPYE